MKRQTILETLGLLAGVALAGCSKPAPPAAAPVALPAPVATAPSWTRAWTVAPGAFAEINLELAAGDAMSATFSTDGGSLAWDVHSHEGHEVTIHARGNAAAGTIEHATSEAGMVSFLWKNEGTAPVRLTVELGSGAAKVHSIHPAE